MAEPTDNTPIPLQIIDEDTIVEIKLNVNYYKRLQDLMFSGLPFKDMEHILTVIQQIKAGDYESDPLANHLFTILCLINDFEDGAKKQGKIKPKNFDPATQKIAD